MPFRLLCTKGEKTELVGYGARVDLLDNTSIHLILSRNWTGSQCLQKVAEKIGLNEISYFGLQYNTKKGREQWVLLDKPLRHQLEKYAANGLSNTVLKLGVHFFVSDINQLRDEITRYYYYLQLRNSVLQGRIPCDEELAVVLASYCAQAEFGDYVAANHKSFVKDYVFLPSTLIATCSQDELNQQIIALHKSHSGLSKADAELEYIKLTQKLDGYGDEYFPATDKDGFVILVGASFMGIVVRHPHGLPPVYFKWQDIVRLSHSKNFFNLESTRTFDVIQFEMEDANTAKYVWRMLVLHHQFCRLSFKTSHSNTSIKPRRMELERQITLPKSDILGGTADVPMRQNQEVKRGNSYDDSRGLVNPLFDEDNHVTQGKVPFSDVVDGFTNHGMSEIHTNAEFPIHRTCSGSTTEGSYRPGSLEYLSEPELKRSSLCSNLSEPMRSRNQSQESLKNFTTSSDDEKLKLLGVGDAGKSSSTDSVNCTGITNWSNETGAVETSNENKPGSSRVHAMNGDMAASEASVHMVSGAALPELRPAQQARSSRPSSQLTDDSSIVTGRTSGYSTSTDSEEFEADDEAQLGPGPEAGPLTRESQLEHLEKLVKEGVIFTEYQKVERLSEIVNVSTAQLPANAARNRYKDVVPYEETRVHLNPRNNAENNDYINASFIKMRVGRKDYSYIAAQGPMENTAPDFWQMIWEQEVRIIVMAAENQMDKKRECHRYWPGDLEKSKTQFGRFILETQSVRDASPFKVRKLCLKQTPSGQQRIVHHLQFNAWPDHGVPENPQCFLEFVEELESIRQQVALASCHSAVLPPMVVHCTAGVGRTGVILMADLMIACLQNNQRINVPKTLINLRRQRMFLVANFGQYRFIYAVVIHYIRNSRLI